MSELKDLDHPCKQTCSGWKQGHEKGLGDKEMLECAKINFENVERAVPALKGLALWKIAKGQLDAGLGYGTLEENLKV